MTRPRSSHYVLGVSLAVLAICWAVARPAAPDPSDREVAAAAALRYAVEQLEGDASTATVVCVAVDSGSGPHDPDRALLERIGSLRRVVAGSTCHTTEAGVVQTRAGQPAVVLTAGAVDWVSKNDATVEVAHAATPSRSGRRTYRVTREAATWVALGQVLKDGPL